MGGDFSADLSLRIPAPASSIPAVQGSSPGRDPEQQQQRRRRQSDHEAEESLNIDAGEVSPHQLDDMA
jgi:hypothetical protein